MVMVFIERDKKTVEQEYAGTIRRLLDALGVDPETVVVVKNGEIVTEDERCSGEDTIKLLSVISGG